MSLAIRIVLKDRSAELVRAWEEAFRDVAEVEAIVEDFFTTPADAIVSPANSFGVMDGGLDLVIRSRLPGIEQAVQRIIVSKYHGEMPVGNAEIVETGNPGWPYLVCAPTMRVPENIEGTPNPYLAMRAALLAVRRLNVENGTRIRTLVVPGLGTGVGGVRPRRCAYQMRMAYDAVVGEGQIPSPAEIHRAHAKLLGG